MADPGFFFPLTHVVYHILLSLSGDTRHGYGIIKNVAERTDGRLEELVELAREARILPARGEA